MASYLCLARLPFGEEGGDDVKSAWLLRPGLHTRYNRVDNAQRHRKVKQIAKQRASSDRGLQLAPVKEELLVTVYQHGTVNTYPGLVHTARHVMGVINA